MNVMFDLFHYQASLRKLVKELEREKNSFNSQLRDYDWRLDQESKVLAVINTVFLVTLVVCCIQIDTALKFIPLFMNIFRSTSTAVLKNIGSKIICVMALV